jgi:hypothetical protein
MMRFARLAALAVAILIAGPASAANQQVNPNTWLKGPAAANRSDGIYFNKAYKSPRLIGNGDGYMPIGPTYFEDFSYGDGLGILCEASSDKTGTAGFALASGANAACNTTCGNAGCVIGFANGGDLVACDGATADTCICQTTSVDGVLAGCGANWEAPALGVTLMSFSSGVKLAHVALLAQDIGPDMDADGLDIGADQTDNDGVEIIGGVFGASGRPMVPGVDPAFKFCATVDINDISGTDEFHVGWRDVTAPNATFNSYNSYFTVGLTTADGDTKTEAEDDGGGTTTTDIDNADLTDDSGFVKFCALVSDAGVASATIGGQAPGNGASYTFDLGEPIVPFLHYLHATTSPGPIILTEWEVSYQ